MVEHNILVNPTAVERIASAIRSLPTPKRREFMKAALEADVLKRIVENGDGEELGMALGDLTGDPRHVLDAKWRLLELSYEHAPDDLKEMFKPEEILRIQRYDPDAETRLMVRRGQIDGRTVQWRESSPRPGTTREVSHDGGMIEVSASTVFPSLRVEEPTVTYEEVVASPDKYGVLKPLLDKAGIAKSQMSVEIDALKKAGFKILKFTKFINGKKTSHIFFDKADGEDVEQKIQEILRKGGFWYAGPAPETRVISQDLRNSEKFVTVTGLVKGLDLSDCPICLHKLARDGIKVARGDFDALRDWAANQSKTR